MFKEKLEVRLSRPISFYWILMWSLSYIACFFIKPDLSYGNTGVFSLLGFLTIGIVMLIGLLLFGCGVLEVFGGVASWTGVVHWNVIWASGYDPLAQITMAILDLISAVFLFHYSLEVKTNL